MTIVIAESVERQLAPSAQVSHKICKMCGEHKPIEEFYKNRSSDKESDLIFYRTECKACRSWLSCREKFRKRYRRWWAERSKLIPARAILKFLNDHPEIMDEVFRKHPTQIKQYMKAERTIVFNEMVKEANDRGGARAKYPKMREQIFEELRREVIK